MNAIERMSEATTDLEIEPKLQLVEAVRNTRTLDGGFPLYENAEISIREFDPNDLYPTAKYVLRSNLQFVASMREEILTDDSVDIFMLDQIYVNSIYVVAPPVVEMSDGVPAIVDGLHRCTLARSLGKPVSVIFVDGVDPTYPIISTPVGWSEIIEYSQKPEVAELLRNVRPGIRDEGGSLRRFYRDFSYLGSAGRRPRLGQSG